MTTHKQFIDNHDTLLQHLEDISRKLASPFGSALTREEISMLTQLRNTESNITHLHSLDQFFANNRVVR